MNFVRSVIRGDSELVCVFVLLIKVVYLFDICGFVLYVVIIWMLVKDLLVIDVVLDFVC